MSRLGTPTMWLMSTAETPLTAPRCACAPTAPASNTATTSHVPGLPHPHDEVDPLALVIVVNGAKTPEGHLQAGAEDLYDAVARAIIAILHDARPECVARVRAWTDDRIRKIVKRARNRAWQQIDALALPHVTVTVGSATVAVFAPLRPSEYPPVLRSAQVAGLQADATGRPPHPDAITVHVNDALHMSTGKTIAQLGHAVQIFGNECPVEAAAWIAAGCAVNVVPGIPTGPLAVRVEDAGFTEVPPGSLTAAISL